MEELADLEKIYTQVKIDCRIGDFSEKARNHQLPAYIAMLMCGFTRDHPEATTEETREVKRRIEVQVNSAFMEDFGKYLYAMSCGRQFEPSDLVKEVLKMQV